MTISLDTLTSNPVGTENGLVTRNIPSGTQMVEVTDGYGNILGTNTNPISVVSGNISRSSRIFVATNVTVPTSEAMLTLTPVADFSTGSTGTSFTVTTGKTLKLLNLVVSSRATGFSGLAQVNLRISSSGTVTTSTQIMAMLDFPGNLQFSQTINFIEGLELSGNNQLGISVVSSGASQVIDLSLIGYEY